jgi:hypothetical protein
VLLHKLSAFWVSGSYVNWFRTNLSNRKSQIPVSGILTSPFEVIYCVPQGSVLGPVFFSVFITTYVMPTLSIYFLLAISESTES